MSLLSSLDDTYCENANIQILQSFSKISGIDVPPNKHEAIPSSKRSNDALNTFTNFDHILTGSNPDTFMFGNAYNRDSDLMTSQIQHLLDQYSTHAASNSTLQFHLFNVRQRHQNINAVSSTLKGDKASMNEFVKLIDNNDFQGQLRKAVKEPQGNDAKMIMHKILPLLRAAGRNTSFGSMERRSGVSHMNAMTRRYGPASTFVTIAPDDINSITGFRLTFRSINNTSFPATMTKQDVEKIREGSNIIGEGKVKLPTSYRNRMKAVINNPHSSSKEYKRLIEQVFGILVNIPVSYKHRKSSDYRQRGSGLFGEMLAFYGVTETQARGALHLHAILYGGLSPYLLQNASHINELCTAISEVLDEMFQAELGKEDHVHDMLLKGLRACKQNDTESDYARPSAFLQHTNEQSINDIGIKTCRYCGVHTHSFTCYSGTHGHNGCRFGYKCGMCKKTGPVQLHNVNNDETSSDGTGQHSTVFGNLRVSSEIEAPSQSAFDSNDPLRYDEKRVITWDICRQRIGINDCFMDHSTANDATLSQKCMDFLKESVGSNLWSQQLSQHVTNANIDDVKMICKKIYDSLSERNGYVVCHNKTLSSLMRCNTAVHSMTSLEASIAITMYLTTYFTKKRLQYSRCYPHYVKHENKLKRAPVLLMIVEQVNELSSISFSEH